MRKKSHQQVKEAKLKKHRRSRKRDAKQGAPAILLNVPGLVGEPGFLLVAPPSAELEWDIEHEIGSTSRRHLEEDEAWWIAASYLHTVEHILERMDSSGAGTQAQKLSRSKMPSSLEEGHDSEHHRPSIHAWKEWIHRVLSFWKESPRKKKD